MFKPYITVHHSSESEERIGYVFIDSISAITFAGGHTYIILNDGNLEVNETPEDILKQISDIHYKSAIYEAYKEGNTHAKID